MATLAQHRASGGPVLLSYGFRPFFLAGAAWAALGMALWLPVWLGDIQFPTIFAAMDWHAHEMLFGFLAAIVAGFLLTAVANWTGRPPVRNALLSALIVVWIAGRVAVALSARLGGLLAAGIDLAFLALLAGVVAREIIAAGNWRNIVVVGLVLLLLAGNLAFHAAALAGEPADLARRLTVATAIGLILLIGGRIIPAFTRNGLLRAGPGRLPAAAGLVDRTSVGLAAVALAAWVGAPDSGPTAALLLAAAVGQAVRLARWAGERTLHEPLLAILHVGYAFVPVGFTLAGLAILRPESVPASAAIHAWTAGAVGVMTLAMMTRVALGHTGRSLTANTATRLAYALVLAAVGLRLLAAFDPAAVRLLLILSAATWIAAFVLYGVAYGPILARPRADARPRPMGGVKKP